MSGWASLVIADAEWFRATPPELFLSQKIKVRLTAGASVDNRGEAARKVLGGTSVLLRENEGELDCGL